MRRAAILAGAVLLTACFVVLRLSMDSRAPVEAASAAAVPTRAAEVPVASEAAGLPGKAESRRASSGSSAADVPSTPAAIHERLAQAARAAGSLGSRPTARAADAADTQGLIDALVDPNPVVHELAAQLALESRDPNLVASLWDRFFQHAENADGAATRVLDVLEGLDQEVDQARAFLDYADPADWDAYSDAIRAQFPHPGE